ncbi:MAG TPA: hypothetical protein VJQ59_07275, partial [Candidatus Sulfotelmatobacter sp.]|nr:hypothetical protein [Candidatus Sulfotelmatobacter sp.]
MRKSLLAITIALLFTGLVYAQDDAPQSTHPTRSLGSVTAKSISCKSGGMKNATCKQLTVSCPDVANVYAYLKINTPSNPAGTVLYGTGTDGNGLYDTLFTYGKTAVQNVYNAGFRTVQISWGTPFNSNQPAGWVNG